MEKFDLILRRFNQEEAVRRAAELLADAEICRVEIWPDGRVFALERGYVDAVEVTIRLVQP